MAKRPAYLTLPGLSTTSLLLNLPCLLSLSDGPTPLILMDTQDYERLRARAFEDQGSNQKYQYLSMSYDYLRRQGILSLINYAEFYPEPTQQRYLDQTQELLQSTPPWVNRKAAVTAVDGWIGYARGPYQEPFRESLGEDPSEFATLRQVEQSQRRKMKRGTGDTVGWNEKVLNKDVAALEVRRRVDQTFPNLDVRYVVAGVEHEITGGILDGTRSQRFAGPTSNVLDIGHEVIEADAEFLENLRPNLHMAGLDPNIVARTREILDTLSQVATEATGVQHDDWFILGPSLAIPQYDELFNFEAIRTQVRHRMTADELAEEAEKVVEILESNRQESLSSSKIQYQADKISEMHHLDHINNAKSRGAGLAGLVDYALDLSDYSRELRTLIERGELSQAAVFVGASVAIDPMRRYKENTVYRQGVDLINRLDPPSLGQRRLEELQKERRGDEWGDHRAWFEAKNRTR